MALNDSLAAGLSKINNAEAKAQKEVVLKPVSKTMKQVLDIMKEKLYVGNYEEVPSVSGNSINLNLLGNINKCGVIKPRFSFLLNDTEKIEKRYLPAKGFGIIIVSTSQGMMTLKDSKTKKIGGKLVAYCY